jgi:hypothetical protein
MQYPLKSIILGHLLAIGLGSSSYADWNYEMLAKAVQHLSEHNCPDGVAAVKTIDRYTSATLVIAHEALWRVQVAIEGDTPTQAIDRFTPTTLDVVDGFLQRTKGSGAGVGCLIELAEGIESIVKGTRDIRNQIGEILGTVIVDTAPFLDDSLQELEAIVLIACVNFTATSCIHYNIQKEIESRSSH